MNGPKLPAFELLKEVRREIATRERVYPDWVKAGKISQRVADHRLRCMRELADILAPIARAEDLAAADYEPHNPAGAIK